MSDQMYARDEARGFLLRPMLGQDVSWPSWQRSDAPRRSDTCHDLDEDQNPATTLIKGVLYNYYHHLPSVLVSPFIHDLLVSHNSVHVPRLVSLSIDSLQYDLWQFVPSKELLMLAAQESMFSQFTSPLNCVTFTRSIRCKNQNLFSNLGTAPYYYSNHHIHLARNIEVQTSTLHIFNLRPADIYKLQGHLVLIFSSYINIATKKLCLHHLLRNTENIILLLIYSHNCFKTHKSTYHHHCC